MVSKQSNQALIENFYSAFNQGNSQVMRVCYHEQAVFTDPVFTELRGDQIGAMWTMLCLQSKDLEIAVSDIYTDATTGRAIWTAKYSFGKSNRPVHNRIRAEFEFLDGKIIRHVDHFNFWKWTRMALGPLGFFLGWHSKVQTRIRLQAMDNLKKFILNLNHS